MKKILEAVIVIFLIAWLVFSVLAFINSKSLICDEVSHHIASGYSYIKTADYRMNPATPSLIRTCIALPLTFFDLALPLDHISWKTNDSPVFGHLFLYEYNDFFEEISFLVRFPVLILSLLLAVLIYGWARRLYGIKAGLFALFLYTFSPSVLGNSGLAMSDIGGTFFIALAVYIFTRFLKKSSFMWLILSGIFFGLAQATKHTAVILLPFYILMFIIESVKTGSFFKNIFLRSRDLLIILFIGFIALWATYAFEFKPLLENAPDIAEKIDYITAFAYKIPYVDNGMIADGLIYFAQKIPIPLSSFFISLLGVTNQVINAGQPLFFMGQKYTTGIKFYYIFLFFIKVPLSVILMLFLSLWGASRGKRTRTLLLDNCSLLLPFILIFTAVSMSKVQGGARYLLPFFPFLYIWIADSVNISFNAKSGIIAKRIFFSAIIFWYAWAPISVYPHFLGYYNELIGGPDGNAYKITHDMHWGQDLIFLRKYMSDNNIDEVSLLYFGSADPLSYGLNVEKILPEERTKPGKKVYAVSVRYLGSIEWAKDIEPTAKAGYSIFIYDMREK